MPPTITQAYPPMDLDELVEGVRAFPGLPLEEKAAFIDRLVGVHPAINLEWGPGHFFRRARKLDPGAPPDHIREVLWRTDVPAAAGRANPPGRPVFYVADRQDTALREVGVDRDWAVVADFEIRQGQSVFICPVGELTQIIRTGRGSLSGDCSDPVSGMVNACLPRDGLSMAITDAFLHDRMVGHDDYEVTSLVATAIFRKLPRVSAIAFSSRRQTGAINLAIRTEGFWDQWGLRGARHGLAEHLAAGFHRLTSVSHLVDVSAEGRFLWDGDTRPHNATMVLNPPFFL